VIKVGAEPAPFVYPLVSGHQEAEQAFRLRILRSSFDGPLEVQRYEEKQGGFRSFRSMVATELGYSELEIRGTGLYRLTASLPSGKLEFLLPLWPPRLPVRPRGEYSSLLADLLPGAVRDPKGIPLNDLVWSPQEKAARATAAAC